MLRFINIILLFSLFLHAGEKEYTLGNGIKLGALPIYVGGYFSTDYQHNTTTSQNKFRIDDIAFLSYGYYERVSYLAEIEFKDFYVYQWDRNLSEIFNGEPHVERLYLNYMISDNFNIRMGKFNSPVGYWNLTPINVLRDTTSNPMISNILYPKFTNGLDLTYTYFSNYEVQVDLLAQNHDDIDDKYNNVKIDQHYALGLELAKDSLSLKLNGGYFHAVDDRYRDEKFTYILASTQYDVDKYKITAEVGTQFSENRVSIDYVGYIEALYRITDKHLPVVRFESYKSNLNILNEQDSSLTFCYTYRPMVPIAFKSEYQFHSLEKYNKIYLSFSVLF
ncbi:hypothetical protein [Sulfurimonas sp.]